MSKTRVTVTIDDKLVEAAKKYAADESLSSWVAKAIAKAVEEHESREQRMAALDDAIAFYEAKFGPMTDEEMEEVLARDRANAIKVRRDQSESSEPGQAA